MMKKRRVVVREGAVLLQRWDGWAPDRVLPKVAAGMSITEYVARFEALNHLRPTKVVFDVR